MKSEDLRREALALSEVERAHLAAELLVSLEQPASLDDDQARSAWATELERRARHLIAGGASSQSWPTVRQRLSDSLNG